MPQPVAYVRDLLAGLRPRWFLCGGWAADAWLGRPTRHHSDVDIAVFHDDQRAIFEHLSGWALVAHDPNVADDTTEPWNGRHLDLPAHIHVHADFEFEFLLNERSGDDWILNRDKQIAAAVDRHTWHCSWGLPTAGPEVVLFYKAGGHLTTAGTPRPHDEQDFVALLPILTAAQRFWLTESLAKAHPGHPWLAQLESAA